MFTGKVAYLFLDKQVELERLNTKKKILCGLKNSRDLGNCIQRLQTEDNEKVANFNAHIPSLKFPTVKNWQ